VADTWDDAYREVGALGGDLLWLLYVAGAVPGKALVSCLRRLRGGRP
jgi:hypothetical protein